jgi:hypothetical protein
MRNHPSLKGNRVADEAASTTTSEQTATETATSEGAATEQQTAGTTAGASTETGDLGSTALGGAGEETAAKTETETEGAKGEVPETYELATPEGFEKLDEAAVAAATPVFKELGLTNEQANKLMPVAGQFAKSIIEQRDQQFLGTILEQRKQWLGDAKADQEIGGTNWDASIQSSARALDRLGFPKGSSLRAALDESGFGNHPEMVRLLARAGKAIGEDSDFVRSDASAAVKPKDDRELFYGPQPERK